MGMSLEYAGEEWADIPAFPNYEISNFGRVWNVKDKRFLRPGVDSYGYKYVNLYHNGVSTNQWIARLVAITFIQRAADKTQVNHIDGDKCNNHVDNLEWMTPGENARHAVHTGLRRPPHMKAVRIIEINEEFESLSDCARFIRGSRLGIALCLSGKKESYKGFTFEHIDK